MKESMTSRVTRLMSGGFHAFVDKLEDTMPEAMLETAVREVEQAIDEVRDEFGKCVAKKHVSQRSLLDANNQHEDLSAKAVIAAKEGRDDLASAAIARQLDIEAKIPVFERSMMDLAEREKELESFIKALMAKKREMESELQALRKSLLGKDASSAEAVGSHAERKVEKALDRFNKTLAKQGQMQQIDHKNAVKLQHLEELSQKHRIDERLLALKNSL